MRLIRKLHYYLAVFFAPTIIFFALSGALQTLGLHESKKGSTEQPPAWIVTMAEIHKHQRLESPKHRQLPKIVENVASVVEGFKRQYGRETPNGPQNTHSTKPVQYFVLAMSLGLMLTALLGIYIALQNRTNRKITWTMLVLGMLLPLGLLYS